MTEIVVNRCYGGFGLSHEATMEYAKRKGITLYAFVQKGRKYIPYEGERDKNAILVYYATASDWPVTQDHDAFWYDRNLDRSDPVLVSVVKDWGERASDTLAKLAVVDIPDDVDWEIDEYDGYESVEEKHRSW